jgi:hypothetical protein
VQPLYAHRLYLLQSSPLSADSCRPLPQQHLPTMHVQPHPYKQVLRAETIVAFQCFRLCHEFMCKKPAAAVSETLLAVSYTNSGSSSGYLSLHSHDRGVFEGLKVHSMLLQQCNYFFL